MSVDLKELQTEVMRNKVEKGFNTTDMALDFCRAHEELSEAFSKFNKNQDGVAEELADVMIFILGMCEILGYDLEKELVRKIEVNKHRKYIKTKSPDGKDIFIREKTDIDP
ncbi:MAG: MazG-like family protein [Candidatus Paceibacterota bacterium]